MTSPVTWFHVDDYMNLFSQNVFGSLFPSELDFPFNRNNDVIKITQGAIRPGRKLYTDIFHFKNEIDPIVISQHRFTSIPFPE